MKKIAAIITLVFFAISLSACGLKPYESDYDEGYEYGYEYGYERGYESGFEDGYSEGQMDGSAIEYEGIYYAVDNSGWSPEEAMIIIDAYQNGKPFWGDGSLPSHKDYLDAINSLIYFYDYFYSAKYR